MQSSDDVLVSASNYEVSIGKNEWNSSCDGLGTNVSLAIDLKSGVGYSVIAYSQGKELKAQLVSTQNGTHGIQSSKKLVSSLLAFISVAQEGAYIFSYAKGLVSQSLKPKTNSSFTLLASLFTRICGG